MRAPKPLLLAAALVAALAIPAFADEEPDEDLGIGPLDEVDFGEQVAGERLSLRDLEGRVVLCYHWCVSCPISTGTFPTVNRLVEEYGDRGLFVIGFQVRRRPVVQENDVVWSLERLQPKFPVVRRGWVCDWPAQWLPWAVVFDHEGKAIFADNLPGIDEVIEEALERAPDYMVGGPYAKLGGLAGEIAADRAHAGRHLAKLREIAGWQGGDPAARQEAATMIACLETYYAGQVAKAEEDMEGPVEQARVLERLAGMFEGDTLGKQAADRLAKLRSAKTYPAEEAAHAALAKARAAFRRLPPPGGYIYHPTDMIYRNSNDPALLARRTRMFADFHMALAAVSETWPGTRAASEADDLLFRYDVPEIGPEGAKARLARAEKLLAESPTPYELWDARLLLYEIEEGYIATDEIAKRAGKLHAALLADRAEEVHKAGAEYRALEDRAAELMEEVRRGGSTLPRVDADEIVRKLKEVAKRAGGASDLTRRVRAYAKRLDESYAGPPQLGVIFDEDYEGPGVRLAWVYPGTAAAKYGLLTGDVIVSFDGEEVADAAALREALQGRLPGQKVKVVIRRGDDEGEKKTLSVVLGRRP